MKDEWIPSSDAFLYYRIVDNYYYQLVTCKVRVRSALFPPLSGGKDGEGGERGTPQGDAEAFCLDWANG